MPIDFNYTQEITQISRVEEILEAVPAVTIANRAVECSSYARAIFHWEQHMRHIGLQNLDYDYHYKHLQGIYENIDEPDAIEGISTHLHVLDLSQQVMDHKRAGRWTAALSFYELAVQQNHNDTGAQTGLLSCLKASGQYGK
jgi:serine/threonine-protein kinase ATR